MPWSISRGTSIISLEYAATYMNHIWLWTLLKRSGSMGLAAKYRKLGMMKQPTGLTALLLSFSVSSVILVAAK
jgi:hypothetical protein